MNDMRSRAKEHFPSVLLTMLSIVQALALELLWSHLIEADTLFELTWLNMLAGAQVLATFLGIVLIWLVYASNVMRFRRTPVTSDLIYPFFIGLVEFMLIATLGTDQLGLWFLFMGMTFAMMNRVAHTSMRQARLDEDNKAFFASVAPATMRDFYPQIAVVGVLILAAAFLMQTGNVGWPAMLLLITVNGLLGWQFYAAAYFWERSMQEPNS